jgi:hypothetical protein
MSLFDLIANAVPLALQIPLAVMMVRHDDYRRYRSFFAYTVYSVAVTAARLTLSHWPVPYFIAVCAGEVFYGILALLAIAEVFKARLQLLYEEHAWLRYTLVSATMLALGIIGVWQALYHPFGSSLLGRVTSGAWGFVIAVRALEIALYVGTWTLRRSGRMAMADRPFRILKGFGLAAFFSLMAYLARYHFGARMEPLFRYLPVGAYLASVWLWLTAFLRPEPTDGLSPPELAKVEGLLDFVREERRTLGKLKANFGAILRNDG